MAARLLLSRLGFNISASSYLKHLKCESFSRRGLRLASALFDALQVRMPSLSPTMAQGTIVKWHKKEGDVLAAGDILCDIQTDKAVLGYEVDEEGILAKILKPDNSTDIEVGTLIALIVEAGGDWKNVTVPAEAAAAAAPAPTPSQAPPSGVQVPSAGAAPETSVQKRSTSYGPAVRSLVSVYNIVPDKVAATGPHGRLLKGDVLKYIEDHHLKPAPVHAEPLPAAAAKVEPSSATKPAPPASKPAPRAPSRAPTGPSDAASFTDIELTTMRSVIAKRLTQSKTTIPHSYSSISCNLGNLLQVRKDLLAGGVKVGVNDFIIKAAAVALQKVPQVNAVWSGEGPRLLSNIDISVAVATDSGLITPIVKDAIGLGVEEISLRVKDLAARARAGKLKPEEFQGGSFTISNLGMFGISSFSAVINPPQACILAVGGARTVLDAECQPQSLLSVTTSSDARMVDDALAAQFLQCFQEVMENPGLMLSHSRPIELAKLFAK